jgi:predicted phosphoribosyltransferase
VALSVRFADRRDAARRLAEALEDLRGEDPVVFGIPRGGVVLSDEVARVLECPMDVVVVRKLGYPGHEEAGFGALGEDAVLVPDSLGRLGPDDPYAEMVERAIESTAAEVAERVKLFRGGRPRVSAAGRTAIVVDDGVATGFTFAAGLEIVRRDGPRRLIGAFPVGAAEGVDRVSRHCDEVRSLGTADPGFFFAVSLYYERFGQVSDEEVAALLKERRSEV